MDFPSPHASLPAGFGHVIDRSPPVPSNRTLEPTEVVRVDLPLRDCRVKRHNAEALFPSESALIDELPEVLAFRREEDLAEGLGRQEVQILIALRLE